MFAAITSGYDWCMWNKPGTHRGLEHTVTVTTAMCHNTSTLSIIAHFRSCLHQFYSAKHHRIQKSNVTILTTIEITFHYMYSASDRSGQLLLTNDCSKLPNLHILLAYLWGWIKPKFGRGHKFGSLRGHTDSTFEELDTIIFNTCAYNYSYTA